MEKQNAQDLIRRTKKSAILAIVLPNILWLLLVTFLHFWQDLLSQTALFGAYILLLALSLVALQTLYEAFANIALLANSQTLHKNFAKSILVFILAIIIAIPSFIITRINEVFTFVAMIAFLFVVLYAIYLHVRAYIEMMEVTGVKLFVVYILLFIAFGLFDKFIYLGEFTSPLIFAFISSIQLLAWLKIKKVQSVSRVYM